MCGAWLALAFVKHVKAQAPTSAQAPLGLVERKGRRRPLAGHGLDFVPRSPRRRIVETIVTQTSKFELIKEVAKRHKTETTKVPAENK